MSTAFVSSDFPRGATVPEDVLPLPGVADVDALVQGIAKLDPAQAEREEPNILKRHGFPNTYVFTKRCSELNLHRRRGNLRLSVSRPAIVAACDKFPFPGWTDTASAMGSFVIASGTGLTPRVLAAADLPSSVIPCDYVVNAILLATTRSAFTARPEFFLCHVCPGPVRKDFTLRDWYRAGWEQQKYQPWENALAPQ